MTKQFTKEDIAKVLQDNQSIEYMQGAQGEGNYYYIHLNLDDLELVSSQGENTEDFTAYYEGQADDDSFEWEILENKDFADTVEDLTNQVNVFLKDL